MRPKKLSEIWSQLPLKHINSWRIFEKKNGNVAVEMKIYND